MSNTNSFEYEEQQEKLAMMKTIYLPMKIWFQSLEPSFTSKFESFPLFWRDLETWSSFKDVKKLYLAATEKIEAGETVDIIELERKILERNKLNSFQLDNQINNIENSNHLDENNNNHDNNHNNSNNNNNNENGNNENGDKDGEDKKRKRRQNRWGVAPTVDTSEFTPINSILPTTPSNEFQSLDVTDPSPMNGSDQNTEDPSKKQKKSRWSTASSSTSTVLGTVNGSNGVATESSPTPTSQNTITPNFALTPEIIQQTLVLQMQLKQLNDKLLTVVQDAQLEELNPNRAPSPPPKYDANGKRLNTREVRMREALTAQRTAVIEQMMKINPLFQPPADFIRQKPFRRLFIPYRDYPNYNFIGLIIGPRGNTQKRMERETGCKISIRGRGSVKEGSKGRAAKNGPDDDEELHCHIQGETEEAVERAAKMVQELLVPVDDEKNEHKQKQLRELALINGTLREEEYCTVCGEKGHRPFECPQRTKTFQAANVRCANCGDHSHPTRDCPLKQEVPANEVALDSEYMSFMAELGDEVPRKPQPIESTTEKSISTTISTPINSSTTSTTSGTSGTDTTTSIITSVSGDVQIEKKGHQTVIKVASIMTGLPPLTNVSGAATATNLPTLTSTNSTSSTVPTIPITLTSSSIAPGVTVTTPSIITPTIPITNTTTPILTNMSSSSSSSITTISQAAVGTTPVTYPSGVTWNPQTIPATTPAWNYSGTPGYYYPNAQYGTTGTATVPTVTTSAGIVGSITPIPNQIQTTVGVDNSTKLSHQVNLTNPYVYQQQVQQIQLQQQMQQLQQLPQQYDYSQYQQYYAQWYQQQLQLQIQQQQPSQPQFQYQYQQQQQQQVQQQVQQPIPPPPTPITSSAPPPPPPPPVVEDIDLS